MNTNTPSPLPSLSSSLSVAPTIEEDPDNITVVDQDVVVFTCTVRGVPAPNITWNISRPGATFNTTTTKMEDNVEGRLTLLATTDLNQTGVHCVAENGVEMITSTVAILTIAGMKLCVQFS